jgi:hypothetical protein
MPEAEIKSVKYNHTLYDFLSEIISKKKDLTEVLKGNANRKVIIALNGLYIQNIKIPSLIAYIPEDKPENVHQPKINERKISAWFYHRGYNDGEIPFEELRDYAIISEKQFNELKEDGYHLNLHEFNYKLIKEENKKGLIARIFKNNKANLSA